MENWIEPIVFAAVVLILVLGATSLIVSFMLPATDASTQLRQQVEHRFFGITGLLGFALMLYGLL